MNDLRVELRGKNNILWHAVFDVAPSLAAFCRRFGLPQGSVGGYLNLRTNPRRLTAFGRQLVEPRLTKTAQRLCEITGLPADELFPMQLYAFGQMRAVAEVESERFVSLSSAKRLALPPSQEESIARDELAREVSEVLETLTPREAMVIKQRFGLDGHEEHTLDAVADSFHVSRERVRQIETKALRKLRNPSRSGRLLAAGGDST